MNMRDTSFAKMLTESLAARQQTDKWELFIGQMLHKLELPVDDLKKATRKYEELAKQVARKLGMADTDVHVVVQGSMRTQTTIRARGNQKFDLDIVVKLSGARYNNTTDAEVFFKEFGEALKGLNESSGDPVAKNRCWRLQYPGEPFYFDVTPAIPGSQHITGTNLRVRDPKTRWSPSNPEQFADWFCQLDDMKLRLPVRSVGTMKALDEAVSKVDSIPNTPVGLDDIPRRFVQLIKLHRDNYYFDLPEERKEGQPISVILVTLAGHAYRDLYAQQRMFASPMEAVLELVEMLPRYIQNNGTYQVLNPAFPPSTGREAENFADRWNNDQGQRAKEFHTWHGRLVADLTLLLEEDYERKSEGKVRDVFGQAGVDAWKGGQPRANVLDSLLGSGAALANPTSAPRPGSKNTLA